MSPVIKRGAPVIGSKREKKLFCARRGAPLFGFKRGKNCSVIKRGSPVFGSKRRKTLFCAKARKQRPVLGAKLPPVIIRGNLCSFQIAGKKFSVLSRAELSRMALVTGRKLTPVIAELLYALKNQISLA